MQPKIAIKIDNQAQFEALMKHYEEKGWYTKNGASAKNTKCLCGDYNRIISYENNFYASNDHLIDCKVLTFDEFSLLTGVKAEEKGIVILVPFIRLIVNKNGFSVQTDTGEESNVSLMDGNTLEKIYNAWKSLQ